ncbi:esterase [Aphanothece hegewaldii CCALA 016]|uniref:Esterase n=1 Tax=Aphanothece hegewaldii CCALA 016 TaxID=2107694 RepID=A0A2T1M193_9CHRO|nr:YqiA/YcfP family alpha/beta fold hydrolase [Aphanothece hegewaldii]PSF38445.1 esterase [Aphanothece hegewaldii CCALA 016]
MTNQYIYLHGFASSPDSAKAQYISDRFSSLSLPLIIPDLNQNDFTHLTLSRQIKQVQKLFSPLETSVTLLGSSFGGLTSAYLAEKCPQVERLVLLAPAFGFLEEWLNRLGTDTVEKWKNSGYLKVYHYGEQRSLPLHYQFVEDTEQYCEEQLQRSVPTLIIHGRNDEVIPLKYSRDFAKTRPWVELVEVESDHALTNVLLDIWHLTKEFCHL